MAPVMAMICAFTGFGIFYTNRALAEKSFIRLPGKKAAAKAWQSRYRLSAVHGLFIEKK